MFDLHKIKLGMEHDRQKMSNVADCQYLAGYGTLNQQFANMRPPRDCVNRIPQARFYAISAIVD
jgi:hypothetical protein